MGKCIHHPDRETGYICMKHNIYLCEDCLECRDPYLYCKFRPSCPVYFISKKGFQEPETEAVQKELTVKIPEETIEKKLKAAGMGKSATEKLMGLVDKIQSLVKNIPLQLDLPSLEDTVRDLDRVRCQLKKAGYGISKMSTNIDDVIDILSEMLHKKVIDRNGKFIIDTDHPRYTLSNGEPAFILEFAEKVDLDENIIFTQSDIGLLPDIAREKFHYMGNSSIAGAYMVLLSNTFRQQAVVLSNAMTYLDFSTHSRFMEEFTRAQFLPHTDANLFPSVKLTKDSQ